MHTIHTNPRTASLYFDCGYDGLLILSYKNDDLRTEKNVNKLRDLLDAPQRDGFYRPPLTDPEILLFENSLHLLRHDPLDKQGGRYPAAQLVHNIHEPEKNMAAAHFLDGQPVNYLMRHSYYQRNKDFILQSTRVNDKGHIVPMEMQEVKTLERMTFN